MTMLTAPDVSVGTAASPITDEHSVLLWQTCAYADDLNTAIGSGRPMAAAYDDMLEFLHYRLLPYLRDEERQIPAARLRDGHMLRLLVSDHERLRADVDNIESSRTRHLVSLAADALVSRLDRHVRREESWLSDPAGDPAQAKLEDWALPLLFSDVVDVDVLPPNDRDFLIRQRLNWMRAGETLRLESMRDLHPLWRRQHVLNHDSHIWVYEVDGPSRWRARITRRECNDR